MAKPKENENSSLKMLSTALDLERKGQEFYEKASTECVDEFGRMVFDQLRRDELIHMGRIRDIYESISAGRGWSEEWKKAETDEAGLKGLFKTILDRHKEDIKLDSTDLDAAGVGVDLEQNTIKFYRSHLDKTTDAKEKAFLTHMIEEEQRHFAALLDMKDYLADPGAWFLKKERHLPV